MTECDFVNKDCVPCRGGVPPLKGEDLKALALKVDKDWQVVDEHHLEKTYKFKDNS